MKEFMAMLFFSVFGGIFLYLCANVHELPAGALFAALSSASYTGLVVYIITLVQTEGGE